MKQIDHLAVDNFEQLNMQFSFEVAKAETEMNKTFDVIKEDINFERLSKFSESIVHTVSYFNNKTLIDLMLEVEDLNMKVQNFTAKVIIFFC